jgi:hypothetical protein
MKVAVLSESPADEAAIRILIEGIIQKGTQEIASLPHIEARQGGWPSVKTLLTVTIRHLYFNTDADALVVVADSDDSPVHQSGHEQVGGEDQRCRLCQLRSVINMEEARLRPVPSRSPLKTAAGLAVPAIEAWYLCGLDPHVNEATWVRKLRAERITFTRNKLKAQVYGTERPSLQMETRYAIEAATRLVDDLSMIEQLFPNGFGSFARDVRSW